MIELTPQQAEALAGESGNPHLINPLTNETFVLLRIADYERLKDADYDDSPWTRDELQALSWEAIGAADREAEDDAGDGGDPR